MGTTPDAALMALIETAPMLPGGFRDGLRVEPLVGDGSDRRFIRLRSGPRHWVALVAPRKKATGCDENDSYLRIGTHLRRIGVPVPEILWADAAEGHFLLEDVGDCHLQRLANRRPSAVRSLYRQALGLLAHLHREAPGGFAPNFCFDTALYTPEFVLARELEYFREAFLNIYLGLDTAAEDLRRDFEAIAADAGVTAPTGIIHRDFQSRNLMVHRGRLWLIDFQGMRFGPPAYDLASLCIDPYVSLSAPEQAQCVDLYWSQAQRFLSGPRSAFMASYRAVRLSRNMQILGAYGFLGCVKGKRQFLRYIPRAWQQLVSFLGHSCSGRYPALARFVAQARRTRRERLSRGYDSETFA